jgi:hypothetical protein
LDPFCAPSIADFVRTSTPVRSFLDWVPRSAADVALIQGLYQVRGIVSYTHTHIWFTIPIGRT